jgi:hypothetical protein
MGGSGAVDDEDDRHKRTQWRLAKPPSVRLDALHDPGVGAFVDKCGRRFLGRRFFSSVLGRTINNRRVSSG